MLSDVPSIDPLYIVKDPVLWQHVDVRHATMYTLLPLEDVGVVLEATEHYDEVCCDIEHLGRNTVLEVEDQVEEWVQAPCSDAGGNSRPSLRKIYLGNAEDREVDMSLVWADGVSGHTYLRQSGLPQLRLGNRVALVIGEVRGEDQVLV